MESMFQYALILNGKKLSLSEGEVTIGRSNACVVKLNDESVSRTHALLTLAGGRGYLRDLNSSNGSYVAGRRVSAETELKDGDVLHLGETDMTLRIISLLPASDPTMMLPKACAKCGARMSEDTKSCPQCGASQLVAEDVGCPNCMTVVGAEARFCNHCGATLERSGDEIYVTGYIPPDAKQRAMGGKLAPPGRPSLPQPGTAPYRSVPLPAPPVSKGALDVQLPATPARPRAAVIPHGEPERRTIPSQAPPQPLPRQAAANANPAPPRPPSSGEVRPTTPTVPPAARERQVPEAGEAAGFGIRLGAYLLDALFLGILNMLVFLPVLVLLLLSMDGGQAQGFFFFAIVAVCWLIAFAVDVYYIAGGWANKGYTPGKKLLGLVVVDRDGRTPLGWRTALLRLVGYVASGIFCIGYIMILFDRDKQGLHDKIAGTRVLRSR